MIIGSLIIAAVLGLGCLLVHVGLDPLFDLLGLGSMEDER